MLASFHTNSVKLHRNRKSAISDGKGGERNIARERENEREREREENRGS